jgi:hypothetical protein
LLYFTTPEIPSIDVVLPIWLAYVIGIILWVIMGACIGRWLWRWSVKNRPMDDDLWGPAAIFSIFIWPLVLVIIPLMGFIFGKRK